MEINKQNHSRLRLWLAVFLAAGAAPTTRAGVETPDLGTAGFGGVPFYLPATENESALRLRYTPGDADLAERGGAERAGAAPKATVSHAGSGRGLLGWFDAGAGCEAAGAGAQPGGFMSAMTTDTQPQRGVGAVALPAPSRSPAEAQPATTALGAKATHASSSPVSDAAQGGPRAMLLGSQGLTYGLAASLGAGVLVVMSRHRVRR